MHFTMSAPELVKHDLDPGQLVGEIAAHVSETDDLVAAFSRPPEPFRIDFNGLTWEETGTSARYWLLLWCLDSKTMTAKYVLMPPNHAKYQRLGGIPYIEATFEPSEDWNSCDVGYARLDDSTRIVVESAVMSKLVATYPQLERG